MENEVKEEVKKEKKQSKGLLIAVIVLTVLVLGLVGYIVYDKEFKEKKENNITEKKDKKENTESKEKTKDNSRELTNEEKEKFENVINKLNAHFSSLYPLNNPSTMINNDELLAFVLTEIGYSTQSFTGADVERVKNEYFGNSVKVTNKDIICQLDKQPFYTYNATTNTYTKTDYNHGHDGAGFMEAYYFFDSGNVTDEKTVTINSKIIYVGYRAGTWGPTYEIFSNYKDAKSSTNPIYTDESKDEGFEVNDSIYQKVKEKLPTTTYTFEKNSDGYYDLKSVLVK